MPRAKSIATTTDGNRIRHRVVKACERCRLRKCRCDGLAPCTRCKADDAICAYGRRKQTDQRVYSKGYVQLLEHQQTLLVAGIQELYRRTMNGIAWPGIPMERSCDSQPLTYQILEALGILKQDQCEELGQDNISTASASHCFGPALPASPPASPTPIWMLSKAGKLHQETVRHETQRNPTVCDLIPPTTATSTAAEKTRKKPYLKLEMPPPYFPSSDNQHINYSLLAAPATDNWDMDWMFDSSVLYSESAAIGGGLGLQGF